jgi:hypothetical protein
MEVPMIWHTRRSELAICAAVAKAALVASKRASRTNDPHATSNAICHYHFCEVASVYADCP